MAEKTYTPANKNRIPMRKRFQRLMGWVIVIAGTMGLFYVGFLMEKDLGAKGKPSSIQN